MKSVFPAHFRPTPEELTSLWKDCLFVVDANVLLNFYRYSPETQKELELALISVKTQLFLPHQAAKEFLKNRTNVTAVQAAEYSTATQVIKNLAALLADKKRHPFLPESELPKFSRQLKKLVELLESQQTVLLDRITKDDILDRISTIFDGRTGRSFDEETFLVVIADGEKRYAKNVPPGYMDGKKDSSGDPYRKFGDLIVWKQLIAKAKLDNRPVIFVTDDKKEDWWLEQSGLRIGPRTELREEFLGEVSKAFWMYTVDRFIAEAARAGNKTISDKVIEEIIEVREEIKAERLQRIAPSIPTDLVATAVGGSVVKLTWNAPSDNYGVVAYIVRRNGVQVATTMSPSYADSGLSSAVAYSYTVAARDTAGNVSRESSSASATTVDTEPPSTPTGLAAIAAGAMTINLTWAPSSDNVGVTGYIVKRNGVAVATPTRPSHSDTGLSSRTAYSYTVSARDAAGNISSDSASASATTP